MKKNIWIKNFIYFIVILVLFILGSILFYNHNLQAQKTLTNNPFYIALISFIFFGGIGVVLGLDTLNLRIKNKGVLKVNISKLILLGIPSFLISLIYVLGTIGLIEISTNMLLYFGNNSYVLIVSSIILGHTIVSSFYKDEI